MSFYQNIYSNTHLVLNTLHIMIIIRLLYMKFNAKENHTFPSQVNILSGINHNVHIVHMTVITVHKFISVSISCIHV